jgi:sarcosine oxidase, subunit delta
MLLIRCPWCGERDETEFHYGGQAHVEYPPDPDALDDAAWGEYLFVRDNPKGRFAERWCHSLGCRRWFNAVRDTATHAMVGTYAVGEAPPGDHRSGP